MTTCDSNLKKALIISTQKALEKEENGASLRIQFLADFLTSLNFNVEVKNINFKKNSLENHYDLILISSFSCAKIARYARKRTKILWFDPYDSWIQSRLSRVKKGNFTQLLALFRDIFYVTIFPAHEITTFISKKDSSSHQIFGRNNRIFIIPSQYKKQFINHSEKIRLVFMGDGTYRPNIRALKFLNNLGKKIGKPIYITGHGYRGVKKYPFCVFEGYVKSEELFHTNDIHIVPVDTGAGIKTKAALPLSLGLRVVAIEDSATGLNRISTLHVAKNVREFYELTDLVIKESWEYSGTQTSIYTHNDLDKLESELKILSTQL